jgi:hypothetical protein
MKENNLMQEKTSSLEKEISDIRSSLDVRQTENHPAVGKATIASESVATGPKKPFVGAGILVFFVVLLAGCGRGGNTTQEQSTTGQQETTTSSSNFAAPLIGTNILGPALLFLSGGLFADLLKSKANPQLWSVNAYLLIK